MTPPPGLPRVTSVESLGPLLDRRHVDLAQRVQSFADSTLAPRAEALNDAAARDEARELLGVMGAAQLYASIEARDLRALCVTREIVAGASPLADAVLALQALGGTAIALGGSEAQRSRWLTPIVSGQAMAAFAMTEPEAGSDVAAMQTLARRDGSGWVLDGVKHLISNAGIADIYVVFAVTTPGAGGRGITAFLVPSGTPGLVFDGAQVLAAPHPLGRLRLDACALPEDAVVGDVNAGFKLGMMTLDRLRPSVGAAACGMAARALAETLAHARSRRQFGGVLASLQLVREKIGRMATELDAARLLVYRAAWRGDTREGRFTSHSAMAKSFATETAQRIVDESVQIAGGGGVLVGHPVERLYRAVRALRIYEGATDILRLVVADGLLEA